MSTPPTRYTTKAGTHDVLTEAVRALVMQPGSIVGVAIFLVARALHWTTQVGFDLSVIAGGITLAVSIYFRFFGTVARLLRTLRDVGIQHRDDDGTVIGPKLYGRPRHRGRNLLVRLQLPPGTGLRDVLGQQDRIEHQLGVEFHAWMDGKTLHAEILRHPIPTRVEYAGFYSGARPAGELLIGLGKGRRGDLWCDLSSLPHLLCAGTTGSGKSSFLRATLTHLLLTYSPKQLRVVCIDLKRVELAPYASTPHAMFPLADTIEKAAAVLEEVRRELDDRLADLQRLGFTDIGGWNDAALGPHWPYVVVVADELAELTTRDLGSDKAAKACQQAALSRLSECARLGRSAGVFLILSTQRPDADAIPGQIKANLTGTAAFRVRNALNSHILVDSDRAAQLAMIPGRGLWVCERVEEFQAVYISAEASRRLLEEKWGAPVVSQGRQCIDGAQTGKDSE